MRKLSSCVGTVAMTIAVAATAATAATVDPTLKANQLPLRFKDANGKVVGRALWIRTQYVVIQEGRRPFAAELRPMLVDGIADYLKADFALGALYFNTPDCTGTPYVTLNDVLFGVPVAVVQEAKDGRRFAYVATTGIAQVVDPASYRTGQFDCAPISQNSDLRFPVDSAGIDVTRFAKPFVLR